MKAFDVEAYGERLPPGVKLAVFPLYDESAPPDCERLTGFHVELTVRHGSVIYATPEDAPKLTAKADALKPHLAAVLEQTARELRK